MERKRSFMRMTSRVLRSKRSYTTSRGKKKEGQLKAAWRHHSQFANFLRSFLGEGQGTLWERPLLNIYLRDVTIAGISYADVGYGETSVTRSPLFKKLGAMNPRNYMIGHFVPEIV